MVRKVCVNYSKIRGRFKNVLLFIPFQIPSSKFQVSKPNSKNQKQRLISYVMGIRISNMVNALCTAMRRQK
ncbi:hypothetical protein LX92_03369 [Maribacter polysiphoniae]|uniref:Uncharacterized protein n=1 Tax=Maribacter polysiphoniae TaxID=429344 RepID=A0A316DUL3_9FLAO|nr:hypothetical protein LX92_03369 [Maribacter polysiphoniae]